MRIQLAIAFAMLAAGCGAKDPCSGESGACVTLLLDGNVALDQLSLNVGDPINKSVVTPNPARKITLPAQVALVFAAGTSGTATLSIDALNGGAIVAHDDKTITVGGHTTVSATLTGGTTGPLDLSTGGGDTDLGSDDLSTGPIQDLSILPGADLSCGNTMTDAANCGTCGHSCLGGTCSAGVCQPYTLATLGSGGSHMVTDGTKLYLRDSFNIYYCPLPTCTGGKQSIAAVNGGGNFADLNLDPSNTHLYFASFSGTGDFRRVLTSNLTTFDTIVTGEATVYNVTVDANNIYWTDGTTVKSCPAAGPFPCGPGKSNLATNGNGARDIVSDGTNVWWSNTAGNTSGAGSIARCAAAGCGGTSSLVVTGLSGPIQTHIFGTKLYWLNFNAQTAGNCLLSNCTTSSALTFLSGQLYYPWGIASDGTSLFIGKRADNKLLGTCALPDCGGTFNAVPINVNDDPKGVIVTANAIYWLAGSGAVMAWAR
jgi:hypothetical protein